MSREGDPFEAAPAGEAQMALRVALTFLWVFLIALAPLEHWRAHGVTVGGLALLSVRLRLPARKLWRRVAVLWLLAGLMALGLVGQPDWGLRAGNLLLKSTLSLWALAVLVHSASLTQLLGGLRWLRLPRVCLEVLAFWGRYYYVLGEEWQRLQLARRARTIERARRRDFLGLASALGVLFIRAFERAEKVHQAMLARGYRGLAGKAPPR